MIGFLVIVECAGEGEGVVVHLVHLLDTLALSPKEVYVLYVYF